MCRVQSVWRRVEQTELQDMPAFKCQQHAKAMPSHGIIRFFSRDCNGIGWRQCKHGQVRIPCKEGNKTILCEGCQLFIVNWPNSQGKPLCSGCIPESKAKSNWDANRAEVRVGTFLRESFEEKGFETYQIGDYAPFLICDDKKRPNILLYYAVTGTGVLVEVD